MPKYIPSQFLAAVSAAAMVCLCAAPAPAQAPPAYAKYPVGPGSLNGVWVGPNNTYGDRSPPERPLPTKWVGPPGVVLKPWAQAIVDQHIKDALAGHPFATNRSQCLPPGAPDEFVGTVEQFVESKDNIVILTQLGWQFNVIRMNQPHRPDPDPSYYGDSVGHWEGDTLVVDTIAISEKTTLLNDVPHSDQLHTITRIRRADRKTLEFKITVEDPKTFNAPFTLERKLVLLLEPMNEYICDNDRNPLDANGNLTFTKSDN